MLIGAALVLAELELAVQPQFVSREVAGEQVGGRPGGHHPTNERAVPRPGELEALAATSMLDMGDKARAVPARQDAADLGEPHSRLVVENPHAIAG